MRILALDLASCTGWAVGSPSDGVIEHGSYRLPKTGEDVGMFLAYFRKWLESTLTRIKADEVIFESPIMPKQTSLATLRKLYGLAGVTEEIVYERNLQCAEARIDQICKHFLGVGYPKKHDAKKAATVEKCRALGFKVVDDNDADAIALLDLAISIKKPSHALDTTPLFGVLKS